MGPSDRIAAVQARAAVAAFAAAPRGLALCSTAFRLIDCDARTAAMLSRFRDDFRDLPLDALVGGSGRAALHAARETVISGAAPVATCQINLDEPNRPLVCLRVELFLADQLETRPRTLGLSLIDVTAQTLESFEHQRDLHRLQATLDNAAVGIISTDWNGTFLAVNRQFERMLGYPALSFLGRDYRDFMVPEDTMNHTTSRAALWLGQHQSLQTERRWYRRDGSIIWTRLTISVQDDLVDTQPYSVVIAEDITEARRVAHAQRLLVGELNHRVKNTLAVVQGIIRQTLTDAPTPDEFKNRIETRIQSIAYAHDLISQNNWEHLGLDELFETTLVKAFPAHASRIAITTRPIPISPHQATTLALIFHELATNALKYGALSNAAGRVELTAKRRNGNSIEIDWRETGGPAIKPPSHNGFGSFLMKRGVRHSLGGTAHAAYRPGGFCLHMSFPLDAKAEMRLPMRQTDVQNACPPQKRSSPHER